MTNRSFCDICNQEKKDKQYTIWETLGPTKHYCEKCWTDKKNWPRIHVIRKSKNR